MPFLVLNQQCQSIEWQRLTSSVKKQSKYSGDSFEISLSYFQIHIFDCKNFGEKQNLFLLGFANQFPTMAFVLV